MLPQKTVRALCLRLEALGFTRQHDRYASSRRYEKNLTDRTIWAAYYRDRGMFWLWSNAIDTMMLQFTTAEELELAVIYLSLLPHSEIAAGQPDDVNP